MNGYPGYDSVRSSFVYRMKREYGDLLERGITPELIIVFGGTNDFWNQSPTGSLQYSGWTDDTLKAFAPAYCYILSWLLAHFLKCRILSIINDDITSVVRDIEIAASEHFGTEVLELNNG